MYFNSSLFNETYWKDCQHFIVCFCAPPFKSYSVYIQSFFVTTFFDMAIWFSFSKDNLKNETFSRFFFLFALSIPLCLCSVWVWLKLHFHCSKVKIHPQLHFKNCSVLSLHYISISVFISSSSFFFVTMSICMSFSIADLLHNATSLEYLMCSSSKFRIVGRVKNVIWNVCTAREKVECTMWQKNRERERRKRRPEMSNENSTSSE